MKSDAETTELSSLGGDVIVIDPGCGNAVARIVGDEAAVRLAGGRPRPPAGA